MQEFGRELGLRAYIFAYMVYGKSIMVAMSQGLFIKVFGIGSFRPRGNMVLRVLKKGIVESGEEDFVNGEKNVEKNVVSNLVDNEEVVYLCPNKSGGLISRLNVRRYVSHSHTE